MAILAIAAVARPAGADRVSLQGIALASAGWTNNILSVPVPDANSPTGTVGPQADWFFELRPSVALTTGSPRAIQRLAYTFDATLYASHSEANSYQNRLDWAGFFLPSKTVEVLVAASLTEGRLNTFNLTQGSQGTMIAVLPPGGTTFIGATLLQSMQWEFEPKWHFVQSLGFNAYVPIDPRLSPNSFEVDTHWIVERAFRYDAAGLDLRMDYATYTEVRGPVLDPTCGTPTGPPSCNAAGFNSNGVVAPGSSQVIAGLVAKWRHDFGHFWNLELNLGGLVVVPANGVGNPIAQPSGLAAIRYLNPYAQIDLSYAHTVQPNTLVGQTFALDSVTLRGGVPFGQKSKVALSAAGGYQHGRVLDFSTGGALSTVDLIVADATLSWTPRRELSAYLRYQYFDQIGNPDDFAPQPSLSRQTVMLGVTGTWPGEAAAVVPTRQALRVDRSDAVGIPEPHSEPQPPH